MSHQAPTEPIRKHGRWEVRAVCGRLLWSRNKRWLQRFNVPRHINSCWKCSFVNRFCFFKTKPALENTVKLTLSFESGSGLAVGRIEPAMKGPVTVIIP